MEKTGLSLTLRVGLLLLIFVAATTSAAASPKVNLTAVFDHRLVQLLRQTSSAFSLKQKSDRELKMILSELEGQNAKPGDGCDREMWLAYMKPIYEALLQDNFIVQKTKNDNFAVAILKDKSVMTKVCMSSTEVLECNVKGQCDCLSILPKDLEADFPCGGGMLKTAGGADGGGGLAEIVYMVINPVLMWANHVFGGGASSGGLPTSSISGTLLVGMVFISYLTSLTL